MLDRERPKESRASAPDGFRSAAASSPATLSQRYTCARGFPSSAAILLTFPSCVSNSCKKLLAERGARMGIGRTAIGSGRAAGSPIANALGGGGNALGKIAQADQALLVVEQLLHLEQRAKLTDIVRPVPEQQRLGGVGREAQARSELCRQ